VLILLFAAYYGLLGTRLMKTSTRGGEELYSTADGLNDVLNEAVAAHKPVFIDFWADWCKNCHAIGCAR
jgi:thiol:disulfide interchange protein